MNILIVESNGELACLWQRHLERQGHAVTCAETADAAAEAVRASDFAVILIDLVLEEGSALGLADYVRIRCPTANLVFVTDTGFFSDGSLFAMTANARALVPSGMPPCDLTAILEHFGASA